MIRKARLPFDRKEFLSKVNGGQRIANYRKDQIVFRQGDPSDAVFYIQSGKAKKTVVSEQGKEAVVALLDAGDFFGEGCLAGETLCLSTVSALTKCTIARISKMG
jgi:CRP/FNR family transcriptional regulator, cyclic AMP receptor protein